ncbi:Protein CBG28063 [Caenorhabditis briggsae]|uniref:Protein CBG28063 n=1 Tax=Caenorhabditis briggsae TaxID=6238 RepID=B6IGQ3_CAEBR|nr:Protein CBG28063 [Caenorhabditis briggsae]CAR99083.1 Protein CBG28063 [Caenorhabditis briggsae]
MLPEMKKVIIQTYFHYYIHIPSREFGA